MNINEIMEIEEKRLNTEQLKFVLVHQKILDAGAMVCTSIISLSKNLKVMRDEKLYVAADCESFEEYSEKICGLKRTQAYAYIQVIEKLGEDFVRSTGQIGITKLTMLASLPEDDKVEILEKVDVENTSVSELEKEIKRLKAEKKSSEKDYVKEVNSLLANIRDLQSRIEDLENSSPESTEIVSEDSSEELEELREKLSEKEKEIARLQKEKKDAENSQTQASDDLSDELENLKETLEEKDNMLAEFKKQNKLDKETISNLQKQAQLSSNDSIIKFKLKFEELQNLIKELNNLILELPEDKVDNCKKALKKVVEIYA